MTQKLISEELYFQNNTATLFHRTDSLKNIKSIFKSEWDFREGVYGTGIYTNSEESSQKQNNMLIYGEYIIKFKYTKLDKLLIFDPKIAREIHGDEYTIKDQLTKLNVIDKLNISEEELDEFQKVLESGSYIQNEPILKFLRRYIVSGKSSLVDGILVDGKHEGFVVVIYPPCKNLYPIAWAYAPRGVEKFVWKPLINSKGSEALRPHGMAELPTRDIDIDFDNKTELNFNEFIKLMNLHNKNYSQKTVNYFFSKLLGNMILNYSNVYKLISNSSEANRDQVINTILNKNVELTDGNVYNLINYSSEANRDIVKKKIDGLKQQQLTEKIRKIKSYRRLCREQYRKHARYL